MMSVLSLFWQYVSIARHGEDDFWKSMLEFFDARGRMLRDSGFDNADVRANDKAINGIKAILATFKG